MHPERHAEPGWRIVAAILAILAFSLATIDAAYAQPACIDGRRSIELIRLVRQDCGSCHGLRLKGGLGPPLLPDSLKDRPEESLRVTILMGRPGTAMPPWQPMLTPVEVEWIVSRLRSGFPEETTP